MNLKEIVKELRECDHLFLTVEGAIKYSQPFGFTARTYVVKANPEDPKGLTLYDGAVSAEGIDASDLALQICHHLKVDYDACFGRGSQLRKCCDALDEWIDNGGRVLNLKVKTVVAAPRIINKKKKA
jgi:hypothetical protein